MSRDALKRPLARLELVLHDGRFMRQDWSMEDIDAGRFTPALLEEIVEPWMLNMRKEWPNPQDPVTHVADVKEGHEIDAGNLMESLANQNPSNETGSDDA